ncbi:MAG: hypothetical protein O3A89_01155 [Actinomycetota bacterium]|nr:hypothetical protein [Actinomycetota bacterium]MDA3014152.1 hypothetical protein [Actinomycetota bacterium]
MPLIARLAPKGVMRTAFRRGLVGGNAGWRAIWFVVVSWRVLSRALQKRPETIAVERLRPGGVLEVRTGRRARR